MANELVINHTHNGYRIALLKNGEILEYHIDEKDKKFSVGDIYLGTVRKLVPGLNAAFVGVGYEKDAFLHYLDLGIQFHSQNKFTKLATSTANLTYDLRRLSIEPELDKIGKISQVLSKNQNILIQLVKEPISNKGPRLSCSLTIAGRYLILIPFINTVHISKKIASDAERQRLLRLISYIKPKNFGIITRTAAEGKEAAYLDRDLKELFRKWKTGIEKLKIAIPGDKIIGEDDKASSILRDMLNRSFENIIVDEKKIYESIKQYLKNIGLKKDKIVKLYHGKTKIFEHFGIEKQIKILFGKTVSIEGGGYLIIEHTEAMHVIDVNSGNKPAIEEDQEATSLSVNLAAAKEIARQLRLRDMGGIIAVDFIDMKKTDNKRHIYQAMKEYMQQDKSKTTILPLSKFCLMQITRQRVKPEVSVITKEQCPTCGGTGKTNASILVSDQIQKNLHFVLTKQNERNITICVHPYLASYFTQGLFSKRWKWLLQYKKWITIKKDSTFGITEFKFFNKNQEEIKLN